MTTKFTQQSEEYLRQIDAEVDRLQQLRKQIEATIQNEDALAKAEPAPMKRGAKKTGEKRQYIRRAPVPEKTATKRSYVRRVPLPLAKKSATKKSAAKKSTAKKTTAKKTAPEASAA